MPALSRRSWVPEGPEALQQRVAGEVARTTPEAVEARLVALTEANRRTHDDDCLNLNPATNMMNPKAEALLRFLWTRAGLPAT